MKTDRPRLRAALLVAVIAVLGAGCAGEPGADPAPAPVPPADAASLDTEAGRAVLDQLTPAVEKFYSYDFQQLDEHELAMTTVTTARYWSEIEPTLSIVREVASSKQVTVSATVSSASLRVLEAGRAEVLMSVNRSTTQQGGPARQDTFSVVVTAELVGSEWKIDKLDPE
jgi:hypothetical protein